MKVRLGGWRRVATAGLVPALLALSVPARADQQEECVAQRSSAMKTRLQQRFEVPGEVVCPAVAEGAADAQGTRISRQDMDSFLTFKAPQGYLIDQQSLEVAAQAGDQGSYDPPSVAGDTVTVGLHCRGKEAGQGESWYRVALRGIVYQQPSPDMLAEIVADCRHCVASASCAAP